MTRRDDVGEVLEGDGAEDTLLDGNGDNTGDAGDRYRGSFSLAPRPQNRPQGSRWISGSRRRSLTRMTTKARALPRTTAGRSGRSLSSSPVATDRTHGPIQTCSAWISAARPVRRRGRPARDRASPEAADGLRRGCSRRREFTRPVDPRNARQRSCSARTGSSRSWIGSRHVRGICRQPRRR